MQIVFACDSKTLDARRTVERLEILKADGTPATVVGQRYSSKHGGNPAPPPEVEVRIGVRELEVLSVSLRPLDGDGPAIPLGVVDTWLVAPEALRPAVF